MEHDDLPAAAPAPQCLPYLRHLYLRKINYPAAELFVKRIFYPRQIFPLHADARLRPGDALFERDIEQEYAVACAEALLQRAEIVSVYDPALLPQDSGERPVKLLRGDIRPIGPVPDHIQIIQGQTRTVSELSGKDALPCAGAADHDSFLHTANRNGITPIRWCRRASGSDRTARG